MRFEFFQSSSCVKGYGSGVWVSTLKVWGVGFVSTSSEDFRTRTRGLNFHYPTCRQRAKP